MRHGRVKGLVLAVAVLAGTVALVAPNAGAVPPCEATIKVGNAEALEGADISFPISISAFPPCHMSGSVSYETMPFIGENAAEPGQDFATTMKTLNWDKPSGVATATYSAKVLLVEDSTEESDELFRVRIFDAHGATISAGSATGTITNDDPVVDLNPNTPDGSGDCAICNEGLCEITVGPQSPSTHPITVGYATIDGTARAGEDFTGVRDGRLTIPAGATMGRFNIEILRNTPGEVYEQFYVVLTSVSAGSIGRGRLEVHILVTR